MMSLVYLLSALYLLAPSAGAIKCYNCLGLNPAGSGGEMTIIREGYDWLVANLTAKYPNIKLPVMPPFCGINGATYNSSSAEAVDCPDSDACWSYNFGIDLSGDPGYHGTVMVKQCSGGPSDTSCPNLSDQSSRGFHLGLDAQCRICNSDYCNSSVTTSVSLLATAIVMVTMFLM